MITWIQKYFQHHFKTVFAVLLVLIIVSFVFITNASGGFSRADRHQVADREFFGYNLSLPADQQRLAGDAQLSIQLQVGMFGGISPEQMQNYAFNRAATLHLADQWHIPAATQDEVTTAIKELRMFMGPEGQFDAKAYQTFKDNLKTSGGGIREGDIVRVLSDDVRADKVNKLLAGPGYVLPADVKQQLKRSDTTWTIATATADYATFSAEIKPTDADLTKAFEQAGGLYDIPPHVVTSYVEFNAAAYLAQVNPTDAEVRAFYDSNPARFPKPASTAPAALTPVVTPAADPSADFAAVRSQVEATLKQERARQLAGKAASDFAVKLYEGKVTSHAALETFLAREKITPKALAPFPRSAAPAELGGSPEAAEQAFRLNDTRVASGAIPTPNGAVVLFWKETLPSRKPLFAEVREKVSADYVESEKRKRFIELGRTAKTQIEARLKAGDTFEKAAAAAASSTGLKLEAKAIPAFTPRNRPQDLDFNVDAALTRLEQGQVSDMISTQDNKGIIVYAAEKKAPDLSESNPAYIEARNQLANLTGRIGASTFIAELVDKELKRSEPKAQ